MEHLCLPPELGRAWLSLTADQQEAFLSATEASQALALRVGCSVAEATANVSLKPPSLIGRKAEKDVLETAARDLQQVVLHTAGGTQAMDGQIPLYVQGQRGRVGIEVKSYQSTVCAEEVAKFFRDVACNDFAAAIFISTKSPIARRRRGVDVECVASTRGPVWCVFVSPVHDMPTLVAGGLALTLELARVEAPSPSLSQALGENLQREIHSICGIRKRLRDLDAQCSVGRDQVADALTASQQRLSTYVDTFVRAGSAEQ